MSPRRAPSACNAPGCPELAFGYCPAHARAREARRGSATARGYDHRWAIIRANYLRRHPLCEECGAPATDVDHIDGLGPRGDNSDRNLQALCHPCHSRKTAYQTGTAGGAK